MLNMKAMIIIRDSLSFTPTLHSRL